jgi:hypothetical protein
MSISIIDILPIGLLPEEHEIETITESRSPEPVEEPCHTEPRVPMELLAKIIKIAHYELNVPMLSVTKVNKACHEIATPLLYETRTLTSWTMDKLPRCILSAPSDDSKLQESHDRKVTALARTTKLVIVDIPVLFRPENDFALKKFCKKVVLPKVKQIMWSQNEVREWTHQAQGLAERHFRKPVHNALPRSRADMFRNVLPAETKIVCVQIPRSGLFPNLGPQATVPHRGTMVKRYSIRTFDRVMEYVGAFTGRVDLRVHQPLNERFLSLANIPATYSFHKGTGTSDQPARNQIIAAYQRTIHHHVLPLLRLHRSEGAEIMFPDLVELLEPGIPRAELRTRVQSSVHAWSDFWKLQRGVNRRDVFMTMTRDVFQAASALAADSTSRCPCCGSRGLPL